MKKIFTSDLNVLLQLYAPANYAIQIFDPQSKLQEDEKLAWYNGDASKLVLINLGSKVEEYRGNKITDFELILNFGQSIAGAGLLSKQFHYLNDSEGKVRWFFPTGKLDKVLPFYNDSGVRGRLISFGIKFLQQLGLSNLAAAGSVELVSPKRLKIETLAAIHSDTLYSIFTGARSGHRSAMLAIFDAKKVTDFVKVPLTTASAELVAKEKSVLKKMATKKLNSFACAVNGSSHPLLLKTKNLKNKHKKTDQFRVQHAKSVLEIAATNTRVDKIQDTNFWEQTLSNMWSMKQSEEASILDLYKKLKRLQKQIDPTELVVSSACHGDFTPWNILYAKEGLSLYDWELYSENATPLYDIFHFVYQRGILMRQENAGQILERLKNIFATQQELANYLDRYRITFDTCHKLYLLSVASYFGNLYAKGELSVQHQWQIKTWCESLDNTIDFGEKTGDRASFILQLNEQLELMPHAFLKFNFDSIENIPAASDLDILVEKKAIKNLLNFCKSRANAKVNIREKSFMTTVELFFENSDYLSLDFIHDFKRKGIRMLAAKAILENATKSSKGVWVPKFKHDLEYAFLFYTLNGSNIPRKYWSFFEQKTAISQYETTFFFNEKYGLDFDNILEIFQLNVAEVKPQILKKLQLEKHATIEKFRLKWNYLIDTIQSAWVNPGFMITFSGVDGAGKSTVIDLVRKELSGKYRKEIVQLRHRPGILPMLNAYRVGAKKAEELATVNLPRKGSNKNAISSLFRFLYYYTDYILGQVYIYFKYLIRGKIVIYDRYYFDFIIDPKRSNIQLNAGVVKMLYGFILKPKLNFFLYADSKIILQRKKELDQPIIDKLSGNYKKLFVNLTKSSKSSKYILLENIELSRTLNTVFKEFQNVA